MDHVSGLRFDPGAESGSGNLCAVGTMESEVGLYDLDILDSVEPILCLGQEAKTSTSRRDGKRTAKRKVSSPGKLRDCATILNTQGIPGDRVEGLCVTTASR